MMITTRLVLRHRCAEVAHECPPVVIIALITTGAGLETLGTAEWFVLLAYLSFWRMSLERNMAAINILLIAAAVVELVNGALAFTEIPNCYCEAHPNETRWPFRCDCFRNTTLTEESTFPAAGLPLNLVSLFLGIPVPGWDGEWIRVANCQLNGSLFSYITAETPSLRNGTNLEYVTFTNFDFIDDVERINQFLHNVKGTLTEMEIVCGQMTTLNSAVLRGFSKLRSLTITRTVLQQIQPGAFSALGADPSVLYHVDFNYNALGSFDWSVLEPVALSLRNLWMWNSWITSMNVSTPVKFPKLLMAYLHYNELTTISADVIATWPKSNNLSVSLMSSPLCTGDSLCRCCSMMPLFRFARQSDATVLVNCGNPTSKRHINITDASRMSNMPLCFDEFHLDDTDYAELIQAVDPAAYDQCNTANPGTMACEERSEGTK